MADATRSVALLGPTNTGKTHRAVERMLEHPSGMLGLPLRLLAREVYDKVSARIGEDRVALVTGEEKRVPRRPSYWICTTEAMPLDREVDFVGVDEIQLATHDERGHVFTDRLLHARGRQESWFMGSGTMRGVLEQLVPAARHEVHPRLSRLSFAGGSKLHKLPPRSAVVAFSMSEVYALAGRLKALRGGAAVVLGSLSPRARNAQVAMFQAGEVDYLVATDAVGMGLNLDVSHVAFASLRKFDGRHARSLTDSELGQIAGRAGRYTRDGSFGTVSPLELAKSSAEQIEQHRFESVRRVRFRSSALDFTSPAALVASLEAPPPARHFIGVPDALDLRALRTLLSDPELARQARRPEALRLLWQVCELPDFRHILFEVHVELLRELFVKLRLGPLDDAFLTSKTQELESAEGDVDALMARMSRLRTWSYVASSAAWVRSSAYWQERLSRVEDTLSDALHARLVDRFVERRGKRSRRGAATLRRPLAHDELRLEIDPHHPFAGLAHLRVREPLREEVAPLALEALADAPHSAFVLDGRGRISAALAPIAELARGPSVSRPQARLLLREELAAGARSRLQRRVSAYARDVVSRLLGKAGELSASERAPLRAIAYQLEGGLGSALRRSLAPSIATLSESDGSALQAAGVVVGHVCVYVPALLKPAALETRALLLSIHQAGLELPPLGRSAYEAAPLADEAWLALGYVVLGSRACRVDLAERAAAALRQGIAVPIALACLSLPKRAWAGAESALRAPAPLSPASVRAGTGAQ